MEKEETLTDRRSFRSPEVKPKMEYSPCAHCGGEQRYTKYVMRDGLPKWLCSDACETAFEVEHPERGVAQAHDLEGRGSGNAAPCTT